MNRRSSPQVEYFCFCQDVAVKCSSLLIRALSICPVLVGHALVRKSDVWFLSKEDIVVKDSLLPGCVLSCIIFLP